MKKVYKVTDHVGILFAGSGEIGAIIIQEIEKQLNSPGSDGVTPVMERVRTILINKYNEWFPGFSMRPVPNSPIPSRPDLAVLIGGYEVVNGVVGEPKIYSLNSGINFAPNLHDYGFALTGVGQYALYLLNRIYSPTMTIEQLLSLGAYVVTETASQDGKVGGPVRALKITPLGCNELEQTQIDEVVTQNINKSNGLKELFGV
jgi:hypothetical protein